MVGCARKTNAGKVKVPESYAASSLSLAEHDHHVSSDKCLTNVTAQRVICASVLDFAILRWCRPWVGLHYTNHALLVAGSKSLYTCMHESEVVQTMFLLHHPIVYQKAKLIGKTDRRRALLDSTIFIRSLIRAERHTALTLTPVKLLNIAFDLICTASFVLKRSHVWTY